MKNSLRLLACILFTFAVTRINAQAPMTTPVPVLGGDQLSFDVASYAMLRDSSSFVDFPITYWAESVSDTENLANFDTSSHVYFDKNDPDAQFYNVSHYFFLNKAPQTWYFFREHGVDTLGNHYYSQYTAMKTAGVVSVIAEQVQKTCSVIVNEKQLRVKSSADYMNSTVEVFSVLGATVLNRKIENEDQTFDLSSQPAGYYIVAIRNDSGQFTKRILIR